MTLEQKLRVLGPLDAYGFYGIGGGFSPRVRMGLNHLAESIKLSGKSVENFTHGSWEKVADAIIADHKAGRRKEPPSLYGHSQGCKSCALVAVKLASAGIQVKYIGAIDPTLDQIPAITSNVQKIDQFWATKDFVSFFRKLSRNKRGVVPVGTHRNSTIFHTPTGHVDAANDASVHARILINI